MINYLIWILVATLYAPTFYTLYRVGWSGDYSHAYFILPISVWLIWLKRKRIKELIQNQQIKHGKKLLGLCIFLLGLLIFIFGSYQNYLFISTLSLIPLLYGLINYLYGINIAKALSFPILYLLLLVPPPVAIIDSVTLPMRHGVSVVTEAILKFFDYPVTREGVLLTIGYHEVFIGPPCSGFRSLITMFSLVLVYVYISKGNLAKKLILTSFIIPSALLGNLIRVITLCLITFYFGKEAGQGFLHNFSGIMIFVITILMILGVESILNRLKVSRKL
jgi:exosortase